ncbi:hypothetical protein QBC35DRAFT_477243 [Podospora australis]|uniref:Secreted protein n=1 Tax=Podospora australis TaxID=1536484 RepID=A0AAN7ADE3_9PEZI|nr:hypothetical protein QBC35DRAFT_477243 [Podospora australis]
MPSTQSFLLAGNLKVACALCLLPPAGCERQEFWTWQYEVQYRETVEDRRNRVYAVPITCNFCDECTDHWEASASLSACLTCACDRWSAVSGQAPGGAAAHSLPFSTTFRHPQPCLGDCLSSSCLGPVVTIA